MTAEEEAAVRLIEASTLRVSSGIECAFEPEIGQLPDGGGADATQYRELKHWLGETVAAFDAGAAWGQIELDSWKATLRDVGSLRQALCGNIATRQHEVIESLRGRLLGEHGALQTAIAALDDVHKAIADADKAKQLVGMILQLKDIAEAIQDPSLQNVAGLVLPGPPGPDDIIEAGIEMLGNYGVSLELVSHGYASLEELHTRITTARTRISELADQVRWAQYRRDEAQKLYDIPAM